MDRNFRELRASMSAEAKAASEAEHRRLMHEMSLHQLRKARELTQTKTAGDLHMGQGDVSKPERRTDLYVSTLAGYLEAIVYNLPHIVWLVGHRIDDVIDTDANSEG